MACAACALRVLYDVKQQIENQAFFGPRAVPGIGRHGSAREAEARSRSTRSVCASYHDRGPLHRIERLAEAFDTGVDLVGQAEVEDQHVIVAA